MEMILWAFLFVLLGIMTVLLIVATVFLVRTMNYISKDLPPVEIPSPVKAYKEYTAKKEAKAEQDKIETILRNIENYDGTGFGQLDVPRG